MDRNNVIYGKPSKNKNYSSDNQDYFIEDLTNILNELMKIFQNIISIYEKSLFDSFEIKQQIDHFSQISHELFYQKTSQIYVRFYLLNINRKKELFIKFMFRI